MNADFPKPRVVHEDNHLLVIDKPPLLATMGALPGKPSLVGWVKGYLAQKYNKPGNVYVGVVSRLDAFTTGLIVMARTSKAASRLTQQFQQGHIKKSYTAILESHPADAAGHLQDWIAKNDHRKRMEVVDTKSNVKPNAKLAKLSYHVAGYYRQLALVQIELQTGRKHQIRVQFSSRGTPILGDKKYGSSKAFSPGIALHSSRLELIHPVRREAMSFRIEPPESWKLGRFVAK